MWCSSHRRVEQLRQSFLIRGSSVGRGVDPEGLGVRTPLKICRGSEYILTPPPENLTFFHSKLLLCNCKFHNIKDEHLDIITSLILLMLTMIPSYF